jgi:hypothetical protein
MIERELRADWLKMMEIEIELAIQTGLRAPIPRARQVLEDVFGELLNEVREAWVELAERNGPPGA